VETAVHKALGPFGIPTREDLAGLHARVSVMEARLDRLLARRTRSRAS
jgi:BMFP domain-containing protein YqiC